MRIGCELWAYGPETVSFSHTLLYGFTSWITSITHDSYRRSTRVSKLCPRAMVTQAARIYTSRHFGMPRSVNARALEFLAVNNSRRPTLCIHPRNKVVNKVLLLTS